MYFNQWHNFQKMEDENENEFVFPTENPSEDDEEKEKIVDIGEENEAKIRAIVYQTNVSKDEALQALQAANYDVIRAIKNIVMP